MRKLGLGTVLVLGTALALSGCAAALIGGAAAGGYYAGKDERTVGRIAEDGAITSAVKSKLIVSHDVKALAVNVDTYEEALALARDCPAAEWCTIEIRKVAPCYEY